MLSLDRVNLLQVMEKLFEIPVDYWESYLNVDEENIYPNQYNTPQTPDGASKWVGGATS